jgi:hypothetical protein
VPGFKVSAVGGAGPAVCDLLVEMPPVVAAAAMPMAQVTANCRRVSVTRDGSEKADIARDAKS